MGFAEVLFIVGPTAVGKSEAALCAAEKLKAEIVSADSMQVYRGLDILSAKPGWEERSRVRHHLIDVAAQDEQFDAAKFALLGKKAVGEVRGRNKTPIVVGGSGMYVKTLVDGIFSGPPRDEFLRTKLEGEAVEKGLDSLYLRLRDIDPDAASKIHPNDKKRIIRALEVFSLTGNKISVRQTQWETEDAAEATGCFMSRNLGARVLMAGLRMDREALSRRIGRRVDRMWEMGAVGEVKKLVETGILPNATIWQSLGIKEIRAFIEGRSSKEEAMELMKKNTRAFAKRQMTWFRKDGRINWIDVQENETSAAVAERILVLMGNDRI